jgi:chemotaxis protein CheD
MIAVESSANLSPLAVGIAQCVISTDPQALLVSYGLGSCVGIAAWDPIARVAGLIHILLPEPLSHDKGTATTRFAVTGIPHLLREIEAAGGQRARLRLVAAGGAQMLGALSMAGSAKAIGARNTEVVQAVVQSAGLRLAAHDFGGTAGRTIGIVVATGSTWVRTAGGQSRDL